MDSAEAAAQLALLLQLAVDAKNTAYATMASLVVVLFDHLLTIEQEYYSFWRPKWSFVKALFLWHRYSGMVVVAVNTAFFVSYAPDNVCAGWFQFEGSTGILTIINIEVIMIFRVWALYERKRWLLIVLIIMLILEVITISTIMHFGLTRVGVLPRIGEVWSGCYPNAFPHFFSAFYIPPTITAFILTFMTLYKSVTLMRKSTIPSRLSVVFFRDGLLYFGIIFASYITNSVIWLIARPTMAQVAIGIVLATRIVVAARLLLNLKEEGRNQGAVTQLESVEMIPRYQKSSYFPGVSARSHVVSEPHAF